MTDSQKLDLILEKVGGLEGRMDSFESRMDRFESRMDRFEGRMDKLEGRMDKQEGKINKLESLLIKSVSELKSMDKLILNEVERVHDILNKHIADKTVHTA